jgi:hypothetical protein
MARKNILHRNKIEEFTGWLIANGYDPVDNAVNFEVVRWKVSGSPMPIIFNGKSKEHLSCNEAAVPFVKMFINQGFIK